MDGASGCLKGERCEIHNLGSQASVDKVEPISSKENPKEKKKEKREIRVSANLMPTSPFSMEKNNRIVWVRSE